MKIVLKKVRVRNLKNVDLELNPNQLIVFTGVSGSGKSSLAFDTLYVEGQRRYIESLPTFARRHLEEMEKPDAELITGLSPTISIEQKTAGKNPRSTVGTMTGIYDYMRVLFARVGIPHCPLSNEPVQAQSSVQILQQIQNLPKGSKLMILAPYAKGKKGEFKDEFADLRRLGFTRIRLNGKIVDLSEEILLDKQISHDIDLVIDRLICDETERLKEAATQALSLGKGVMLVLNLTTEEETLYSEHAFSKKSGLSYPPLEPHDFSFNHPSGMCPVCQGLGTTQTFDLERILNPDLSIAQDCCLVAPSYKTVRYGNIYDNLARLYKFNIQTPWKKVPEPGKKAFLYGIDTKWTRMQFVHPTKKTKWTDYVQWKGVLFEAQKRYSEASSDLYRGKMEELMHLSVCSGCLGSRLRAYPAATRLNGKKIGELTRLPIQKLLSFFQEITPSAISEEILKEIIERLKFLMGVGLHYLTLERTSPTLSGGEAQRVRLASQIGSGLISTTYILDEPSIGLHPRDNRELLNTLKALKDKGNTVIVVEHDEETILAADHIVDVGPLAGDKGGHIVVSGSVQDLLTCPQSITGGYLSKRISLPVIPKRKIDLKETLTLYGATHHNLKTIDVSFPLGRFVAITGVSGSGKSSLITDTLYPALSNHLMGSQLPVGKHKKIEGLAKINKVIAIDQTPIGRTPRSNPSTYIKLFDDIRDLFSHLPESLAAGFKSGRFSFNVKEGSCPHCEGMGMVKIDMDFMEDAWNTCAFCNGKRFDEKTLSILFKGKNIHDILQMSVEEALLFFEALPSIRHKLETLKAVGLDYIRLGQPSPSLSGGEAQRIKLAKELSRPGTGKTLYILDEPTTGLHFHDISKLITVLHTLVDKGNSVFVIEHNTDLMKSADWIIELGPEGGEEGGFFIAHGTQKDFAKLSTPTALALRATYTPQGKNNGPLDPITQITIRGANQNNLKNVSCDLPRGHITVCTGPSGSGKSSFAFETVYAEGQRRYIDSLSLYARQYVKPSAKPKVENIEGLSAAIAIEQKSHAGNPRSTVGTQTEAYDYLRLIYAHLGTPFSPESGQEIRSITKEYVVEQLLKLPEKNKLFILSPLQFKRGESFEEIKSRLQKQGFLRIRLNGKYHELEEEIPFNPSQKNLLFLVCDRLTVKEENRSRLLEAIEQTTSLSEGVVVIDHEGTDLFFNLSFTDPSTGRSYPPITPHTFSFNTESGMCPDCLGLGFQYGIDFLAYPEIFHLTPLNLLHHIWKETASKEAFELFESILQHSHIDPDLPLTFQPKESLQKIVNGPLTLKRKGTTFTWQGINAVFAKAVKLVSSLREPLLPILSQNKCLSCEGTRLHPLARHVKIQDLSIADFCKLSIPEAIEFLEKITPPPFLKESMLQLTQRLTLLKEIGLSYLSLDRSAPTLSGGEAQRIRLSRQLGSGLTGCLYVLDEPSIGLHPRDNHLLNQALLRLKNLGNTLLLVEHDPLTIEIADYILDFGPGAGKEGGMLCAQGTLKQLKENPHSLTGAYLSGKKQIPLPEKRRKPSTFYTLAPSGLHNLKQASLKLPLGLFTCITGVSGSGKSTLIYDVLKPHIEKELKARNPDLPFDQIISIDQNPLGHTIRADVTTYIDLSTHLRTLFATLPMAKARGLQPKHFSPNHKKGMCPECYGLGTKSIALQFLPPVKITCPSCLGFRLNPLSLTIAYKEKHLGHIFQMTVKEARLFLEAFPKIVRILDTLIAVGLGYLQLGQEIVTLSGGEQQRIRLARELKKRSTGKTVYLLDEPTIGLHPADIGILLPIFHALVQKGNTLVIIEHNLEVIKNADYLIDLGPGAGSNGGQIVAEGSLEDLRRMKEFSLFPYI